MRYLFPLFSLSLFFYTSNGHKHGLQEGQAYDNVRGFDLVKPIAYPDWLQIIDATQKNRQFKQRFVMNQDTCWDFLNKEPELVDGMVFVKGGTFAMGSTDSEAGEDEKPVHTVSLSDFYMRQYEVTVGEFKAFVDATGYKTDAEKKGEDWVLNEGNGQWEKKAGRNWREDEQGNVRAETEYDYPVIYVSWNDAKAYCEWLSKKEGKSYSLPTEAQWEYAARSQGKPYQYAWGNGLMPTNGANVATAPHWSHAQMFEGTDAYQFACPVQHSGINEIGLYGMSGNVLEWCNDWYDAEYYSKSPSSNPTGATSGTSRVLRGGSWRSNPQLVRCTYRSYEKPARHINPGIGFRLVCVP